MKIRQKSAIIPYRFNEQGKIELLLVRNILDTKWVIPKGTIAHPLSSLLSATKEAFEEAGVLGRPLPIVVGRYRKNEQEVPAFLLEVEIELAHYEEETQRRRHWVGIEQIDEYVLEEDLRRILHLGKKIASKRGQYFKYALITFAEINGFELEMITKKNAVLVVDNGGIPQRVHISRSKSTVEFVVFTQRFFQNKEDVPDELAVQFLIENSEKFPGFWALKEHAETGNYTFSRIHDQELFTLDEISFGHIVNSLIEKCNCLELSNVKEVSQSGSAVTSDPNGGLRLS